MSDTFNDGLKAAIAWHQEQSKFLALQPRGPDGMPSSDSVVVRLWHSLTAIELQGLLKKTDAEIAADADAATRRAT